jgi:hypothetical protein
MRTQETRLGSRHYVNRLVLTGIQPEMYQQSKVSRKEQLCEEIVGKINRKLTYIRVLRHTPVGVHS